MRGCQGLVGDGVGECWREEVKRSSVSVVRDGVGKAT